MANVWQAKPFRYEQLDELVLQIFRRVPEETGYLRTCELNAPGFIDDHQGIGRIAVRSVLSKFGR